MADINIRACEKVHGDDLLRVLESFGKLDWAVRGPSIKKDDVFEDVARNPHSTFWRWKNPDPELGKLVVEAVESFRGQVEWTISSRERRPSLGGRNWGIRTLREEQLSKERKDLNYVEIDQLIREKEPEIGILSNQDVPKLAEHIKQYVEENRQSRQDKQPNENEVELSPPSQPKITEELLSFKPEFPSEPAHVLEPGIEGLLEEYFGQSYDELYQKYNSYRIIPLAVASYKERVEPVAVKLSISEIEGLINREYDEKTLKNRIFPKYGIKVEMSKLGVTYIGFLERVHEELVGKRLYY